jgi:hypothetical protein
VLQRVVDVEIDALLHDAGIAEGERRGGGRRSWDVSSCDGYAEGPQSDAASRFSYRRVCVVLF